MTLTLFSCISHNFFFHYFPWGSRWEDCFAWCHTVPIWRLNVHLCVPLDSCFEPKWWGDSTWFHFCNIHASLNVGKLFSISADGSFIPQSRELYADCICSLCGFASASHCDNCMSRILIYQSSSNLWIWIAFKPWLSTCLWICTVIHCTFQCERWEHVIIRVYSAHWLLHIWGLCGHILAIHHENEVPIHPRGGKKHHHELFPHSSQHLCVRCAVQCEWLGFIYSWSFEALPTSTCFWQKTKTVRVSSNSFFLIEIQIWLYIFSVNNDLVCFLFEGWCISHHHHVWYVLDFPLCGCCIAEAAYGDCWWPEIK